MKLKTIQIRVEKNASERSLDDYLRSENYTIENAFASLKDDAEGSFWEVLIFYKENDFAKVRANSDSKKNMHNDIVHWVEKKAIEIGKTVEAIESISLVYEMAQDFKNFNSKADFLKQRNYGEKKFKIYGKDILEIFRKYQ